MNNLLKPKKWLVLTFDFPLKEQLYKLADGVIGKHLRVAANQEENLREIWRTLGMGPKCQPVSTLTVYINNWLICGLLEESLKGLIKNVKELEGPDFSF